MARGFSIVELMIVVAVLGILAAVIVPQVQSHSVRAREAATRDGLRLLRGSVEVYAARHGGIPPGYEDDDPQNPPSSAELHAQIISTGRYMSKMPKNPFNGLTEVKMVGNAEAFPAGPTGAFGWIYQPATKTVRLDWPGVDTQGVPYYSY